MKKKKRYIIGQRLSEMALMEWELHSRVAADMVAENTEPIGTVTIMHKLARANPKAVSADRTLCLHSIVRFNGIETEGYDYFCVGVRFEDKEKLIKVIPIDIIHKVPDAWDAMSFWVPAKHMSLHRELTVSEAQQVMKGEKDV